MEDAERFLAASSNNVKLAILMALTGMDAAQGEVALRQADGFLRRAAAQHQPRAAG
ncbi:N-acetylmuramic acid-6-phosphate etherase [compost metagenome]